MRLTFSGKQSARTILTVTFFPIISKAWFSEHPFDSSQLVAPLGSGPYKVGRVSAGQTIVYERVADYWGRDLPVNRGLYNFDVIRIDVYRERQAGFEAFKKGDVTFRQEFTSRVWATGYDFPALKEGKVVRREFPDEKSARLQGWAINQRRAAIQGRARAPRDRPLLRFRMDEQEPVLRSLRAVAILLPAVRIRGGRHALARRAEAA